MYAFIRFYINHLQCQISKIIDIAEAYESPYYMDY